MRTFGLRAAVLSGAVLMAGGCDLLLTDPAPAEPSVDVSFSVAPEASQALDDAFDRIDRVYLLLIRPDSARRDTILPLQTRDGTARARLVLKTNERVSALGIVAQLRAGDLALFEGAQVVRIQSGVPTSVEIPILPAVSRLRIDPPDFSVGVGDTIRLSAQVLLASGDALDVPVAWASSDPKTAAVSPAGVVMGRAPGLVGIVARYLEFADTAVGRVLER